MQFQTAVRVAVEEQPKLTRSNTEVVPNQSRSGLEALPKDTRTAPEETGGVFAVFLTCLKRGSSIDAVRM
ncbi:hypothetical protein H8B06_19510 [Sphingobacterium sp. DN00404]|uniref:Uncharacterized protein n=1 Tax=Sphingobacterium micropteri TaxID=2763501 RepID=A0ABR7YV14_9SPHI|nr:hypothetical protein [Sphingobacterium micropteri]MBD1435016.1 hypothetical protein [Sphingobacterium micropteri]